MHMGGGGGGWGEGRKEDEHQMMPWKESVTLCGELQLRLVGFTISENKNHLNVHGMSLLIFSKRGGK